MSWIAAVNGREEEVFFDGAGPRLEGRLHTPATRRGDRPQRKPAAVVCHPHPDFGGSMDNNVVDAAVEALLASGVTTLRFNFRGVGRSEGQSAGGEREADDVRAALDHVETRVEPDEIVLVGYSFGAAMALAVGREHPSVTHLIAIAPPLSMMGIETSSGTSRPVLLIGGSADPFCAPKDLEALAETLAPHAAHVLVNGADHFFGGFEAALRDTLRDWIEETL